jgi:SPP1 gp7 family putative phage head morphogenesis protein
MSLEDSLIRRLIFIQRFAGAEAKKAEDTLLRISGTVQARLLREPTEFQEGRLKRLRDDINNLLGVGFRELNEQQIESILAFSENEAEFAQKAMQLETGVILSTPAIAQIEQAVFNTGMDAPIGPNQITIREALAQFAGKKSREINTVINDGILLGDTTPQIAKDVGSFVEGKPKAQVNALTRTLINHASNQAHKAVSVQNSDILKGDEWVATLDSSTTLICGGRDGRIYPIGKGPFPPAHWSCRSIRVPVIKDEFDLNDDTATRASKGEEGGKQVSAKTTFDGWLRKQPAGFQDEYFSQFPDGAEKAALFRRGGLEIQQFRDEAGRDFTLDQLKALEPLAFEKANIDI